MEDYSITHLFLTTNLRPGHGEVSLSIKPGMAENHDKVEYYAKKTYSFVIQSTLSPDFLFTLPVHQEGCASCHRNRQASLPRSLLLKKKRLIPPTIPK